LKNSIVTNDPVFDHFLQTANILFQDLVVNTQYSLVTLKNSASFKIVVNNALKTNTVEDKKWIESFQKRSNSFPESIGLAEKFLLENSKTLLFAPSIPIKESMTHYPCLITTTSQVLFRVGLFIIYNVL